jgi:hypothetical protein
MKIIGSAKNCKKGRKKAKKRPKKAQNWDALYGMADPEDKIQYFNAIIMWFLELHAPLCRYIVSTDVKL